MESQHRTASPPVETLLTQDAWLAEKRQLFTRKTTAAPSPCFRVFATRLRWHWSAAGLYGCFVSPEVRTFQGYAFAAVHRDDDDVPASRGKNTLGPHRVPVELGTERSNDNARVCLPTALLTCPTTRTPVFFSPTVRA